MYLFTLKEGSIIKQTNNLTTSNEENLRDCVKVSIGYGYTFYVKGGKDNIKLKKGIKFTWTPVSVKVKTDPYSIFGQEIKMGTLVRSSFESVYGEKDLSIDDKLKKFLDKHRVKVEREKVTKNNKSEIVLKLKADWSQIYSPKIKNIKLSYNTSSNTIEASGELENEYKIFGISEEKAKELIKSMWDEPELSVTFDLKNKLTGFMSFETNYSNYNEMLKVIAGTSGAFIVGSGLEYLHNKYKNLKNLY